MTPRARVGEIVNGVIGVGALLAAIAGVWLVFALIVAPLPPRGPENGPGSIRAEKRGPDSSTPGGRPRAAGQRPGSGRETEGRR